MFTRFKMFLPFLTQNKTQHLQKTVMQNVLLTIRYVKYLYFKKYIHLKRNEQN